MSLYTYLITVEMCSGCEKFKSLFVVSFLKHDGEQKALNIFLFQFLLFNLIKPYISSMPS